MKMSKPYDIPIIIQKHGSDKKWKDEFRVHASINKSTKDNEYLSGGALQSKVALVFEMRYFKELKAVCYNTQVYRILFDGEIFNIKDYDDFQLEHKTVKLLGVSQ